MRTAICSDARSRNQGFHHLVGYNWDTSKGCPSFLREPRGNQIERDPAKLNHIKTYPSCLPMGVARNCVRCFGVSDTYSLHVGFVVLSYYKRGVGKSTGNRGAAGFEDVG